MRITNKTFNQLSGIGTVNGHNRISPTITQARKIGVAIEQTGSNKAINVQVTVPVRRNVKGSRRVATLNLSGAQARELYRQLQDFFEMHNLNNDWIDNIPEIREEDV